MLPLRANLGRWLPLVLVLLVALVLRVALWGALPRQGLISDEAEYLAAAEWLAQGRGFAWYHNWLWTRAPLYPLFLAAHIWLFGFDLAPIYISQTLLSLLNVVLVYVLARQLTGGIHATSQSPIPKPYAVLTPVLAALFAALYLPFATYPQILLSETLYISLLLGAFVALGARGHGPEKQTHSWLLSLITRRSLFLLLAGVLLGLAALTRGLTLGFLPLVALWLVGVHVGNRKLKPENPGNRQPTIVNILIFMLACACTILPWSLYASKLYGGPVLVDTTGAFNLMLGARAAYDGERSDAPTRNFLLALLDETRTPQERRALLELEGSCLLAQQDPRLLTALETPPDEITQAQRQQLMTAEGLCLLRAAPGAFAAKSAAELVDLFQINYTGAERMSGGFSLGRLPHWYTLALFLLDDTMYVLMLPLAVLGWVLAWRHSGAGKPLTALVGMWWLYNLLTAPLLFAINRFRLPLLPFACIYAALALVWWWRSRFSGSRFPVPRIVVLLAVLLLLLATAPWAYLQQAPASWASYLGPYPSSLANTLIAWNARPTYLHERQVIDALGEGQPEQARTLIERYDLPTCITCTLRLAPPLLAGLEGRPKEGLSLLPDTAVISATRDWRASVVRGDLLRRLHDWDAARAAFTPGYVDDQNPVNWAWEWLHPVPTRHIDLGGNLDLGYITSFYLGEGDQSAAGDGTFRWSGPQARLLFPGQGHAEPQQLCLRADGRGWPTDMPLPRARLLLEQGDAATLPQPFATLELQRGVRVYCGSLPSTVPGADVVVLLHSPVFVPRAADLLAQQGPQAGQLRLLGLRLDWVELR